VTGHARSGELPDDLDWRGLADTSTTLVAYMAVRTAGDFAARLMAHGLASDTPVAAVSNVSRAGEARWYGRLGDIAAVGLPPEISSPALLGIGQVFGSADAMAAVVTDQPRSALAT